AGSMWRSIASRMITTKITNGIPSFTTICLDNQISSCGIVRNAKYDGSTGTTPTGSIGQSTKYSGTTVTAICQDNSVSRHHICPYYYYRTTDATFCPGRCIIGISGATATTHNEATHIRCYA